MHYKEHIKEMMNRYHAPFYFYDLDGFEQHLKDISRTTDPAIKIWYATKANPLSDVLRIIKENGFGVCVASYGELRQAKEADLKAHNLMATGPAKTKNYLAALMQAEVNAIVIESFNQLKDLNTIATRLERKQNVLLGLQLADSPISPLGLTAEEWKNINVLEFPNLNIVGIHCIQTDNITNLTMLQKFWFKSIQESQNLFSGLDLELKILDLGSGVGIPYSNNDHELNYKEIHSLLVDLKRNFEIKEIWLELGRFFIGKFGSYFTKIIDKKTLKGKDLLIAAGGINHLGRPSLVHESFPCEVFNKESRNIRSYNIHGPLSTDIDFLGSHELSEDVDVSDWLEFKQTGAYGFTESLPYFQSHDMAGEAFIHMGELTIPRAPTSNIGWTV